MKNNSTKTTVQAIRIDGQFHTHAELMENPDICPKLGDVVEVIDSPVKAQNGIFFITSWNSAHYCGKNNFYGTGLKKDLEQETKTRLYWPPMNTSGTAAGREANRTMTPKMRVLGPVSRHAFGWVNAENLEARKSLYRTMEEFFRFRCAEFDTDRNGLKPSEAYYRKPGEAPEAIATARDFTKDSDFDPRDSWAIKYFEETAGAALRMIDENGDLLEPVEKEEPKGPGLKIAKNGLYVREENGTWNLCRIYYSQGGRKDGRECVTLYAKSYRSIPRGFALDVVNDSDSMTDYFEEDRATVYPEHPLFSAFVNAANGGKPYTLTDADAEALKAYTDAKKAAADAKREQEEAERAAKEEAKEQHAREVIAQYVELFPGDSYHPHIIVQWSELNAMAEHALENAGELNDNGATVFSVEAWENITGELDAYFKEDLGYNKTKFEFIDPINDRHFIDRCDIGEGTGSYGTRARHTIKWCKEHASEQYYMKDGGACCSHEEGAQEAQMYLDCIPATFDDLNAMD